MRVAGALALIAGLAVAAVLALLPVQLVMAGGSVSCGTPAVRSFTRADAPDPAYPNLAPAAGRACVSRSRQQLLAGGVAAGIAVAGGTTMMVLGRPRRHLPTGLTISADWWWNGRVWISSAALGPPPGYRGPWYSGTLPPPG